MAPASHRLNQFNVVFFFYTIVFLYMSTAASYVTNLRFYCCFIACVCVKGSQRLIISKAPVLYISLGFKRVTTAGRIYREYKKLDL